MKHFVLIYCRGTLSPVNTASKVCSGCGGRHPWIVT